MMCMSGFFFFKQKTAYELRISDWSSDVCSSDLDVVLARHAFGGRFHGAVDVAHRAHFLARLGRRGFQFGAIGGGVVARVRPVVPLDFQRFAALDRKSVV